MPRSQEDFVLKDETEDAAEHPAAAEGPDQEDRRLFEGLLDHRQEQLEAQSDDRRQSRFPGAEPVSHDTDNIAAYKEILSGINPRAALAFSNGDNIAEFSPERRAEYALAHIQAFRSAEFPAEADRVEAANQIAGQVMDPLRHQLSHDLHQKSLLNDAELATFHPADRDFYKFIHDRGELPADSLSDINLKRMNDSVHEAVAARGEESASKEDAALTGIDLHQLAFARELIQAGRDPLHEHNAAAILNGAVNWTETAADRTVDFHAMTELAGAAGQDDDRRSALEALTETVISAGWNMTNLTIDGLAAVDQAAAAAHYALSSQTVRELAGQMADGLLSGIGESEFDLKMAEARQAAEKHLEYINFHAGQEYPAFKDMSYEELRQNVLGMIEDVNNGMKDPALQDQAQAIVRENQDYVLALDNLSQIQDAAPAGDPTEEHGRIQLLNILREWRDTFEKNFEMLQTLLHIDQRQANAAAAA